MSRHRLIVAAALALTAGLLVSVAVANSGQPSASPRAEGAPGAPWGACKLDHTPGTEAFRTCVRNAAKARGQGIGRACAQHRGNPESFRNCVREAAKARGQRPGPRGQGPGPRGLGLGLGHGHRGLGPGRACAQHKGDREAFRTCIRGQIEQRKAQRQQLRAAIRQCRQQHPTDRAALRDCVQAARR